MSHAHSSHTQAVVRLAPTGPVSARLERALLTALGALERARQRRALALLDSRLLKDIGLTREQAEAEARKSAWRP
jgi:uncharacterized protein YjiS (DUF1127 family)